MITIFCTILIATLPAYTNTYSSLITMTTSTAASITNYYQDFASCSCDLTPSLCDNYCCCDSLCSEATSWSASNLCLKSSSSIETPCGQSTRGFGAIQDLACVYLSNRGTIGYYYQSATTASLTYPTSTLFSSIDTSQPYSAQSTLVGGLSLGSSYSATNQYIKTSSTAYLFVPLPGAGGSCVPGLVNITTSGTFVCKIIPTAQNCAKLNQPYVGTLSICQNRDCSSVSSTYTVSTSAVSGSNCNNILSGFTLTNLLGYSNGLYTLQSTPSISTISVALNTQITVTIIITSTNPTTTKSGNPGYLVGKSIKINGGISQILDSSTGNCATSSTGLLSVPFNTKKTVTCPSPTPCASSYYIDQLANLTLTIDKYASQSSDLVSITKNNKYGCKAEGYTINILYSMNGWMLDPQYYILSAQMSDTPTPDGSEPTSKYLRINWIYVDPATVTTIPQNSFYTYFSYLWTPLKQKFGLAS